MQTYDVKGPMRAGAAGRRSGAFAYAALTGMILTMAGCASQTLPERTDDLRIDATDVTSPASSRRAAYEYHVLAGEMAIQRGNRERAATEYVAALDYSNDAELAQRATRIALYAGDAALAYRAADAWARAQPDSLDAQRIATRLALVNDDAAGLAEHAPALVDASASPDIGYSLLADVLSGEDPHADLAVETLSGMAQQDRGSAAAQYALGVLALRYGRNAVAQRAAERALALEPEWNDAVLLQAGVWIRNDEPGKAQALVDDLPGNAATRAEYHMALARLLIEADQDEAALDEFRHAIALQPDNNEARYGQAILSLSQGDLDQAEDAFTRLYESSDRSDDAAYYLGTIAEQRRDYAEAAGWYQRVENGAHAFESQVRAARMIYKQGDLAGARARLVSLRSTYPELANQLYAAEGQMLYEANQPVAAVDIYDQGLEEVPGNAELLYGRSIAYERLGRVDAAEADLRAVLDDEPDDARALNALGYLLTNHTRDYDRALDYIQKALAADPDNPAILDSMGWVQYRLGHLDQARHYLERAYRAYPDGEVAAHLGEVLWAQGDRDAARRVWQDALADNPDHPILRATMNRLDP
ncbi:tetratricopeptide repeat protein [Salinisphaera sp. T31B1]|uniref:tetratricopeptide repeat protein n=1 Tax=Salinisphaera sp. T31B1 TaxID=727963 RepID=UPI00333E9250